MLPKTTDVSEEADYLLKLSEAASDLGLGKATAKEITDHCPKMNSKTNAEVPQSGLSGAADLGGALTNIRTAFHSRQSALGFPRNES